MDANDLSANTTNTTNSTNDKENQTVDSSSNSINPITKKKKFTIPSFKDAEQVRSAKIDAYSLFEKRKDPSSTTPQNNVINNNATTPTSSIINNNNTTPKQDVQTNNNVPNTTPLQANKNNVQTPLQKTPPITRSPYFSSSSKPSPSNNNTTPQSDNNNNNSSDSQENSPPPRTLSFGEAFSFIQSDPSYSPPAISAPLQTPFSTNVNNRTTHTATRTPHSTRSIIIHANQRKNPMLRYVKKRSF